MGVGCVCGCECVLHVHIAIYFSTGFVFNMLSLSHNLRMYFICKVTKYYYFHTVSSDGAP